MTAREPRSPGGKVTRRDVTANRARLLAAVRDRPDGTARELARAAGVSVATLYRHFPTRDDLVAAAYAEQRGACAASVERAAGDPDAGRALATYLRDVLAVQAAAPEFVSSFPRTPSDRARFHRDLSAVLARARTNGAVRPDATVADLLLIFAANRGVTASRAPGRQERSRRLLDLARTGLELPGEPVPGPR